MNFSKFIVVSLVICLSGISLVAVMGMLRPSPSEGLQLPIYPGAQGFGADTPAGRGGEIIKVTTLADSGAGSLRAALEGNGRRIVVFDVAGIVSLEKDLVISSPYVTVAGQTSPPQGIIIKGAGIVVAAHDVLIQHIRIRCGDNPIGPNPASRDAMKILNPSYNVVIDHVSTSWATDENMSIWSGLKNSGVKNVTISNSIISEGLQKSIHPIVHHSKGFLVGGNTENLTLIGNLFAHNMSRNPLVYGNTSMIVVNNIFYNTGTSAYFHISDGWHQGPSKISIIGNIFIDGPDTPAGSYAIKVGNDTLDSKVFLSDNRYAGQIFYNKTVKNLLVTSPPTLTIPLDILDSTNAEKLILSRVGARPADRDSVDKRVVQEVRDRTGKIIDSQKDVGGWPVLENNIRHFTIPNNPGGDDDSDGYTNIEEVLHRMAIEVETPSSLE